MAKFAKQSIVEALSLVWQQQWSTLEQHKVGAALGDDPEHLHRLRVALRQIRALLKAFKNNLSSAEARHFSSEFKWLAAATSEVRDFDVVLINLRAWSAMCGQEADLALLPVAGRLVKERAVAQRRLRQVLAGARYRQLVLQWQAFVAALPQSKVGAAPARELAALEIAKQSLRLLQGGLAMKRSTSAQQLHDLRICGKRLRYVLESFAPLLGHHRSYRPFRSALKVLQEELGDYRDNDLVSVRAVRLLEQTDSWPQAQPWLVAWRQELVLRKRRARAAVGSAVAVFAETCRDLPS